MATIILWAGGSSNNITSGNISFSRQGVYDYVFTYGNRLKRETTLVTDTPDVKFNNNLTLEPNWDTSVPWDAAEAKTKFTKYQDHYRRYSFNKDDTVLEQIDTLRTIDGSKTTPIGYREFESTLVKLSTDTVELSPYASIEVDTTWEKAPFIASVDNNSNVPSLLFNIDIQTKNITKDMVRAVTISFHSLGRLYKEGYVTGSNIDTDYHPFLVVTKERFRKEETVKTFRDSPATAGSTTTAGDTDQASLDQYAANQQDTFRRIMTGGTASLIGDYSVNTGDTVDSIRIYYDGAYVVKPVNLLVTSRSYSFETDTTTIGFSRA